jgi:cobalt/nickel transport system permease protein
MKVADWIEIGRMDDLGRMDTPVHRLDARAKALVTLAFVVAVVSFPRREFSALTPFLLYPVALISLGRIPASHIARKILVAAPFALAIGIFNPLMDRQPVALVGPFAITGGWLSFASIMLRFVLTVGAALALVACTGMYRLGAGLERLGVPSLFVVQVLFLYRYLFVAIRPSWRAGPWAWSFRIPTTSCSCRPWRKTWRSGR